MSDKDLVCYDGSALHFTLLPAQALHSDTKAARGMKHGGTVSKS